MNFNCPKCTQTFECEDSMMGEKMECPSCNSTITIPAEVNIPPKQETVASMNQINWRPLSRSITLQFDEDNTIKHGQGGSAGHITPNIRSVEREIEQLCEDLSNEGWEIKSVVPLVSAGVYGTGLTNSTQEVFSAHSWGGGYGYGASFTTGVVIIIQKWIEVNVHELKSELSTIEEKLQEIDVETESIEKFLAENPVLHDEIFFTKALQSLGLVEEYNKVIADIEAIDEKLFEEEKDFGKGVGGWLKRQFDQKPVDYRAMSSNIDVMKEKITKLHERKIEIEVLTEDEVANLNPCEDENITMDDLQMKTHRKREMEKIQKRFLKRKKEIKNQIYASVSK